MTGKEDQSSTRICALNDELRRFGRGGRIMLTPGIQALGAEGVARVLAAVAAFNAFTLRQGEGALAARMGSDIAVRASQSFPAISR